MRITRGLLSCALYSPSVSFRSDVDLARFGGTNHRLPLSSFLTALRIFRHGEVLLTLPQTSPQHQYLISLSDIANIERTDLKPYCLLLETKDKRWFLSLKNDEELYGWQDDIYSRSPMAGVSNPTNFVHKVHVGFDPVSGAFTVRRSLITNFTSFLIPSTGTARCLEQTSDEICYYTGRLREGSSSRS